ncbi:MAG: YwaF family protein [Firmicutes bacterium]|nr:YwaF family protein [Bacillota bacterium]
MVIPHRFSWQHLLILALVAVFTIVLCLVMRRRSELVQRIVFITLGVTGVVVFMLRWLFGWHNIFTIAESGWRVGGGYSLFPLELCHFGLFILMFAAIFRKRWLFVFAIYVNVFWAAFAFLAFPRGYMYPVETNPLGQWMFYDFFIIHTLLIALPIAFIVCGWYRPKLRDALPAAIMLLLTGLGVYIISVIFNHIELFTHGLANYMYTVYPSGQPILQWIFDIIPIPFVFGLPLIPLFFILYILVTLPFLKKDERREQWRDLWSRDNLKTLGFKSYQKPETPRSVRRP